MYMERWLTLFRILLSTLILLGLLWLVLTGWPNANRLNTTADWSGDPTRPAEELEPLLWKKEAELPGICTAVTT
jgi:hypothetical protein